MNLLMDLVEIDKPTSFACDKHHIHYHQSPVQKMWSRLIPDYYPSDELYKHKNKTQNYQTINVRSQRPYILRTCSLDPRYQNRQIRVLGPPSSPAFAAFENLSTHTQDHYITPKRKPPKATLRIYKLNHKNIQATSSLCCYVFFLCFSYPYCLLSICTLGSRWCLALDCSVVIHIFPWIFSALPVARSHQCDVYPLLV